ncbi:MAG: DNA repair ATPase, partial [Flavobacteriales bacterium]|nr:DNA repair ATPase [Flavobacteriales bacterium]
MAEENENIILEEGTYEIIQNRLKKEGKDLTGRLLKLNQARKEVFGAIETKLLATERVTTKNNCVARDIIMLGDTFLFGYNVHMGLKSEMKLSDVFSAYTYKDNAFHETSLKFVEDKKFVDDFLNLYKYYRDTQFVKFAQIGVNIFMVFQVGKTEDDIKTFKWTLVNGKLKYIDNRSDHEFKFPNQHEFKWQKPKREQFRSGRHPHISIEDRIFVETVGGDLTIKIEDNTDSGLGIYSEPVNEKDQNLGDAAIQYAIIENLIILKIKPYKEDDFRYIVYNEKIEKAVRIDALENSCIFLPDNQGIIFSKGYYAQTGEFKLFDNQQEDMIFEKRIVSQNGEDYLFTFYNNSSGTYILLPYNLIEQSVGTPIVCHGFTLLENGELLYFKGDDDQKKHHAIQIWQTPFIGPDFELKGKQDSYLFKLGNKEIVKAMAECRDVIKLIEKDDSYNNLYIDLVKKSTDIIDTYHWLTHKDAFELRKPLEDIKGTSNSAISEFEKVVQIKKSTKKQTSETLQKAEDIISKIKRSTFEHIDEFVNLLSELRVIRGEVISLKELRYVELDVVNQTEETLGAQVEGISENCIQFLLQDESLKPYEGKVATLRKEIEGVSKNADAELIAENISDTSKELEMLIEIVSNLKITDPTKTTEIVDHIGSIYAEFNQVNSILKQKRKELFSLEGRAEFNAQIKLISQGVVNYLDVSDSPEKCEEYLNKLMIQLEELEGKFSEFEEFTDLIHDKREEIYNAFESRKLTLVEEINRKTTALSNSADRILKGIHHKLSELMTVSEINGYYASDIMVDKVRDIVKRLMDLGDSVKADRIQSQLKSAKEEALRQLKDKNELYLNGQDIVKFGKHQFTYNKQKLDLTMVLKDSDMYYHLSGTDFFEKVNDLDFNGTKEVWGQTLTSENQDIYRAEYLAHTLLSDLENEKIQWKGQIARISTLLTLTPKELLGLIQTYAQPKYSEGYVKG